MSNEEKNRLDAFLIELAELTDKYSIAVTECYHDPTLTDLISGKYIAEELEYDFASKTYMVEEPEV